MYKFILCQAQLHSSQMPDADGTGKFAVVIGVISVLFVGIAAYLFLMDRKLKKLEDKQ